MKKIIFLTTAVLLLLCSTGTLAQTKQEQPNALEKMHQLLGNWQAVAGKDTIELWECQSYGKALIINVSFIIGGKKIPLYVNSAGFDARDGKTKGFALWQNGDYMTWVSVFDAANKFTGELLDSFAPGTVWAKYEMTFVNPIEWTWKMWDMNGKIIDDYKFAKVK
jgi:hypothetical protein